MTDIALQRTNMVESQIRPSDVTDRRILRAMAELPRERFVAPALAPLAYADEALPLSEPASPSGRRMLSPRTLAKLLQLARIEPTDSILVVGSGRGYGAAVTARLGGTVIALEEDESLQLAAKSALNGTGNVSFASGVLSAGATAQGPFDVIILEGTADEIPDAISAQLKPGGRLVAVINSNGVGQATLVRNQGRTVAFEAEITPLPGFQRAPVFSF